MSINNWKTVDSEESIAEFLQITHGLHDSCITSVEFSDGRFVDESGSMHCGLGDRASLILKLDSQSGMGCVARYVLSFDGVFDFYFDHHAADDGLILSCSVSLNSGSVQFRCNPGYEGSTPSVNARTMKYAVVG
jgi:hypothetical protein